VKKERYLLIKLRATGDTVVLSSSISALKKARTGAIIDLIIPESARFAFENHPLVERMFCIDTNGSKWLLFYRFLLSLGEIRKVKYDYVLNFHANYLSGLISFLISTKVRAVYNQGVKKRNLFSNVFIKGKGEIKSIIEKDYDVLRSTNIAVNEIFPTEIFLEQGEVEMALSGLVDMGVNRGRKVIAIHPGASKETKKWIPGYYFDLAGLFDSEYEIIFFYSKFETADVKKIKSYFDDKIPGNIHFIKTGTIKEFALFLKGVDFLLAMDSGPKHVAVALDVPTLTIFSSEPMGEFHPYSTERHRVLRAEVDCRPNYAHLKGFEWCGLSKCDSMKCMKDITPVMVKREIMDFFKGEDEVQEG